MPDRGEMDKFGLSEKRAVPAPVPDPFTTEMNEVDDADADHGQPAAVATPTSKVPPALESADVGPLIEYVHAGAWVNVAGT